MASPFQLTRLTWHSGPYLSKPQVMLQPPNSRQLPLIVDFPPYPGHLILRHTHTHTHTLSSRHTADHSPSAGTKSPLFTITATQVHRGGSNYPPTNRQWDRWLPLPALRPDSPWHLRPCLASEMGPLTRRSHHLPYPTPFPQKGVPGVTGEYRPILEPQLLKGPLKDRSRQRPSWCPDPQGCPTTPPCSSPSPENP